VRHSAAITFSLLAQMPVSVFTTSVWLPIVCPGVESNATPGPISTSPSMGRSASGRSELNVDAWYHGTCNGCSASSDSSSARCTINRARGSAAGMGDAGERSLAGSVVPTHRRTSCVCRWSNVM